MDKDRVWLILHGTDQGEEKECVGVGDGGIRESLPTISLREEDRRKRQVDTDRWGTGVENGMKEGMRRRGWR